MRRLVVALIAALLALGLVGCGGAEPADQATEPTAGTPAPAAAAATPAEDAAVIEDRSDLYGEVFELFPSGEGVPAAVNERLTSGQAMLLLFYNSAQDVTNDVRKQVEIVADDNQGAIDLITYDLGKYTKIAADGTIVVDEEGLKADEAGGEAVNFARSLGIDHAPYIIVVDDRGYQIFWSRGVIDAELLDRQVQRATD